LIFPLRPATCKSTFNFSSGFKEKLFNSYSKNDFATEKDIISHFDKHSIENILSGFKSPSSVKIPLNSFEKNLLTEITKLFDSTSEVLPPELAFISRLCKIEGKELVVIDPSVSALQIKLYLEQNLAIRRKMPSYRYEPESITRCGFWCKTGIAGSAAASAAVLALYFRYN
jgi:hypothetical protein